MVSSLIIYIGLLSTGIAFFFSTACKESNIPKSIIQYSLAIIFITIICILKHIVTAGKNNHDHKYDCANFETMLSIVQALSLIPWATTYCFELLEHRAHFLAQCHSLITTTTCLLILAGCITLFDIAQFVVILRYKQKRWSVDKR